MKNATFPKLVTWMFLTGITFLIFMTILRFTFFFHFRPTGYKLSENFNVFLLGLNYDLRIVCGIVLLPFLLGNIHLKYNLQKRLTAGSIVQLMVPPLLVIALSYLFITRGLVSFRSLIFPIGMPFALIIFWIFAVKNCSPFESSVSRKIFNIYFIIISLLIAFLYSIDFQYYDYMHERLNAVVWNYTADAKISMNMVWQTYPVIIMFLLIIIGTALSNGLIIYWFKKVDKKNYSGSILTKILVSGMFALLLVVGIFGKINLYPLRFSNALKWSDAFSFQDNFKANLALNPVQSFLSTLQLGNSSYDLKKVKEFYPLIVSDLDIKNPDIVHLNYDRIFQAPHTTHTPNVVLVICESFSAYKSSMWGNPLNTTPYFNELCRQGIFFDRCFTPGWGTSRGIWATITGIPDIENPNTSSRNPGFVDQRSIINEYKGYEKFYFVGGSVGFENIGALLNNNIQGLKIYEEENFKSKRISMWGISDKRLFLEANDVLKKQVKPFFAVIQTSGNHRPYTFAEEDKKEFKLENYPLDTLKKYGFQSSEELNAFRYTDFSFEKFIEAAKNENYFKNTIFVFVGDHGISGNTGNMFPRAWELDWLSWHQVPLLFYAPSLLSPKRISRTVSQLDVLPSVSALADISFTNTTLGKNLFDTIQNNKRLKNARFLFTDLMNAISIVTDQYVYTLNLNSKIEDFRSSKDDVPLPQTPSVEEDKKESKTMAEAYYETAKYMLSHNKKKP